MRATPRRRVAVVSHRVRNEADHSRTGMRIEFQNASVVWPDKVRPEASLMVPETIRGRSVANSSKDSRTANKRGLGVQGVEYGLDQDDIDAAFDERARRQRVAGHQFIELMLRKPGSLTSGDSERYGWWAPARLRRSVVVPSRRDLVPPPDAPDERPPD